jgi:predicted nucleic acid-binding protein
MLVDTSVWVDHLSRGNGALVSALEAGDVWCHPLVQGELACGHLNNRREILSLLAVLPKAPEPTHTEALAFLEARGLMGMGMGWVDIHLLASALLAGIPLWTLDRPLARAAAQLGLRPSARS